MSYPIIEERYSLALFAHGKEEVKLVEFHSLDFLKGRRGYY